MRETGKRNGCCMVKFSSIFMLLLMSMLLVNLPGTQGQVYAAAKPSISKKVVNTYVGKSTTLKVKNAGKATVKWTSSNKKAATVNSKGVVKAKKAGTTWITAKVSGKKLKCLFSVSSKAAYKTVKDARVIVKAGVAKYSQAFRMSNNYFDCSSLVWRVYEPHNVNFGVTYRWAPTAAAQGQWCVSNGKKLPDKVMNLNSYQLVAGDTLYYAYGSNGRYMNIDHTAIFAGYQYNPFWDYYSATVIDASRSWNAVVERSYYTGSMVMAARPTK